MTASLRPGPSAGREAVLWILAAAALWLVGWWKGINLILLLSYVMAAAFGFNAFAARREARSARCRPVEAGDVFAGVAFRREVDLSGGERGASTALTVTESGPDHAASWLVTSWPGEEPARLSAAVTLPRRGVYRADPPVAASGYPFGLIRWAARTGPPAEILVLPRPGRVDRRLLGDWLRAATAGDGRRHRPTRRPFSDHDSEIDGVRPFRPGDSPRRVHWRSTARRGQLMVREYADVQAPDLLLVVDAHLGRGPDAAARLEAAVGVAAAVAWSWNGEANVDFALAVVGAEAGHVSGRGGRRLGLKALGLLAREAGAAEPDPALLTPLLKPGWSRMPALVVSAREGSPLPGLLGRHYGRPAALVGPGRLPGWYRPPEGQG